MDGTNFIGATDSVPFNIRINNQKAGRIDFSNTFYGYQSGNSNTGDNDNTGIGYRALYSNTTGSSNTANGYRALYNNTTGNYNTALGYNANVSANNLTNATAIGNGAIAGTSNTVRIGNASITQIGGYAAWSNLSDERFKSQIKPLEHGLDFIMKLQPITYHVEAQKIFEFNHKNMEHRPEVTETMKEGWQAKSAVLETGFSAQQVEKAAKEVGYDFYGVHHPANENDHYSLAYGTFTVPLVKAVQEQQKMIEELKSLLEQQQKNNEQQQQQIDVLYTK